MTKKEGYFRFCLDYLKRNMVTLRYLFSFLVWTSASSSWERHVSFQLYRQTLVTDRSRSISKTAKRPPSQVIKACTGLFTCSLDSRANEPPSKEHKTPSCSLWYGGRRSFLWRISLSFQISFNNTSTASIKSLLYCEMPA